MVFPDIFFFFCVEVLRTPVHQISCLAAVTFIHWRIGLHGPLQSPACQRPSQMWTSRRASPSGNGCTACLLTCQKLCRPGVFFFTWKIADGGSGVVRAERSGRQRKKKESPMQTILQTAAAVVTDDNHVIYPQMIVAVFPVEMRPEVCRRSNCFCTP